MPSFLMSRTVPQFLYKRINIMDFKVFVFVLFATISYIRANDDRHFYTVESVDQDVLNKNVEDVQIIKIGSDKDSVTVQMFYEVFCYGCRIFDTTEFKEAILKLGQYVQFEVYPYGNANTTIVDGHYEFSCQHGPYECYGNKLHACAIDYLNNKTLALLYNSCMMEEGRTIQGSEDEDADECGKIMKIDPEPIKACAKSEKGSKLLFSYGEYSKKIGFRYVPYVLINGMEYKQDNNFIVKLCAAFKNPPPPCKNGENY